MRPIAVHAAKAQSPGERDPEASRHVRRWEDAHDRAQHHDPPNRDPDLAADDCVVATASQSEIQDEEEGQHRPGEHRPSLTPRRPETEELAETVAANCIATRIDLAGMRHLILEIRAGRENPD